jgi:hypothetical protein
MFLANAIDLVEIFGCHTHTDTHQLLDYVRNVLKFGRNAAIRSRVVE